MDARADGDFDEVWAGEAVHETAGEAQDEVAVAAERVVEEVSGAAGGDGEAALPLPPAALAAAVGALLLLLLLLLYFMLRSRSKKRASAVLLLGASGSGKTAMLMRLKHGGKGASNGTVTSMEANEAEVVVSGPRGPRAARVVDLPGHPRLRVLYDDYLDAARAVVYVVDAEAFDAPAAAEGLAAVLRRRTLARSRAPVLLACNKMDRLTAYPVKTIVKRLEREIEALRTATKAKLTDIGGDADAERALMPLEDLAPEGRAFSFEVGCPLTVTAAAVSVAAGKLDDVEAFIAANW